MNAGISRRFGVALCRLLLPLAGSGQQQERVMISVHVVYTGDWVTTGEEGAGVKDHITA